MSDTATNIDALRSAIRQCIINTKANACPMSVRLAWHSSGTFDKASQTGGSNGATMRFDPEESDPANAGLSIIRDMLKPVKEQFPNVSYADIWAVAGAAAVEFSGGPRVPVALGRRDDVDGRRCPANGRLPDGALGAEHLRDVFYRMGLGDQEIVALSGGHTLGRCHEVRSGFDGPWTTKPLAFDNEYFVNLLNLTWKKRNWAGKTQYQDEETGKLMMLPSDMALLSDPKFRVYVEMFAKDEKAFHEAFATAYAKLLILGCPPECDPFRRRAASPDALANEFRTLCMHGSFEPARALAARCNVHALEPSTNRSALHKASFWGHNDLVKYLVQDLKIDPNVQDSEGDTALHDAARFGHETVVDHLLSAGARVDIRNKAGKTPACVAKQQQYGALAHKLGAAKL